MASVGDLSLLGTAGGGGKKKGIFSATTKQDSPSTDSDMESSGFCGTAAAVTKFRSVLDFY